MIINKHESQFLAKRKIRRKRGYSLRVEIRAFKIFRWQVLPSKGNKVLARKFSSAILHWLF